MSTIEVIVIAVLVSYAIGKQLKVHVVTPRNRFRLAAIYLAAGLVLGLNLPHSPVAVTLLAASVLVSVAVGWARGLFTRVWAGADGRIRSQGSLITIGLFVALIASKFLIGAVADGLGIHEASMGEILMMISVSIAVQAQVVWRRAERLARSVHAAAQASDARDYRVAR